jgi:hypothetical protein
LPERTLLNLALLASIIPDFLRTSLAAVQAVSVIRHELFPALCADSLHLLQPFPRMENFFGGPLGQCQHSRACS